MILSPSPVWPGNRRSSGKRCPSLRSRTPCGNPIAIPWVLYVLYISILHYSHLYSLVVTGAFSSRLRGGAASGGTLRVAVFLRGGQVLPGGAHSDMGTGTAPLLVDD